MDLSPELQAKLVFCLEQYVADCDAALGEEA